MRRVSVAGISGSGKSTFSPALAERLGVAYVELDALHHGPDWREASADELRERVEAALAAAPDGWVVDGNYHGKLGDTVLGRADTLVWLELPLLLCLHRIVRRTSGRIVRREELWNGNRETVRNAILVRDNLISWAIKSHRRHKTTVPAAAAANPHLALVHLRSPRQVADFLAQVSPSK